MSVNYKKLWKLMIDKNLSKTELTHLAGISTNAMAKLGRNEDVRVNVLEKLCTSLDCKLDDIVEFKLNRRSNLKGKGVTTWPIVPNSMNTIWTGRLRTH